MVKTKKHSKLQSEEQTTMALQKNNSTASRKKQNHQHLNKKKKNDGGAASSSSRNDNQDSIDDETNLSSRPDDKAPTPSTMLKPSPDKRKKKKKKSSSTSHHPNSKKARSVRDIEEEPQSNVHDDQKEVKSSKRKGTKGYNSVPSSPRVTSSSASKKGNKMTKKEKLELAEASPPPSPGKQRTKASESHLSSPSSKRKKKNHSSKEAREDTTHRLKRRYQQASYDIEEDHHTDDDEINLESMSPGAVAIPGRGLTNVNSLSHTIMTDTTHHQVAILEAELVACDDDDFTTARDHMQEEFQNQVRKQVNQVREEMLRDAVQAEVMIDPNTGLQHDKSEMMTRKKTERNYKRTMRFRIAIAVFTLVIGILAVTLGLTLSLGQDEGDDSNGDVVTSLLPQNNKTNSTETPTSTPNPAEKYTTGPTVRPTAPSLDGDFTSGPTTLYTQSPTVYRTYTPTQSPHVDQIRFAWFENYLGTDLYLEGFDYQYVLDPVTLLDTSSPQYKAVNWLSNIDQYLLDIPTTIPADLGNLPNQEILQRYILAVFYFTGYQLDEMSYTGDGTGGFIYPDTPVCQWYVVSCDGSNSVTDIDLGKNDYDDVFESFSEFDCVPPTDPLQCVSSCLFIERV